MSTPLSIKLTILVASTHHQYSARVARPLKSAYLRIQVLTECCRVIIGSPGDIAWLHWLLLGGFACWSFYP